MRSYSSYKERYSTFYLGLSPASSDTNKPGFGLHQTDPVPPGTVPGPGFIPDRSSQPQPQDPPSHTCRLHSVSLKSSDIHSHLPNSFLWSTYHIQQKQPRGAPQRCNNHAKKCEMKYKCLGEWKYSNEINCKRNLRSA